jgi:hypothetical protein
MFNYGMKVTVYSEKKACSEEVGWHRACSDISYFRNQIRKDGSHNRFYYSLTFTYTFEHSEDNVFFAYCYPYSYTDLNNDIAILEADPLRRKLF